MATILAVDGDEASLETLRDILSTFGHGLATAGHRAEALARAEAQSYDLILLDALDESLDAPGLTKAILARRPDARIVAVTAYAKATRALAVLEAGGCCLMRKPYEIGLIRGLLEGRCP